MKFIYTRRTVAPLLLTGAALTLATVRPAYAHFLWADIPAGGSAVRVSFGEEGGEPVNGVPMARIEAAKAWGSDGAALTLKEDNGYRVAPLGASGVAGVSQTWGVLDKTAEGRGIFLLEYYAKAAKDVAAAGQNARLPLEVFLTRGAAPNELVAQVKQGDKPAAAAKFTIQAPGAADTTDLVTGADGTTRFVADKAGLYSVRAAVVENKAGKLDGKEYPMVRSYSTLTFANAPVGAAGATPASSTPAGAPGNTPVVTANATTVAPKDAAAEPKKADPAAYALLKAAHDARQTMPADFSGFTADVTANLDGKAYTGTVRYEKGKTADVKFDGLSKDDTEWVSDQLQSIIGHRRGGDFAQGDGSRPLTLGTGPDAENSFGKLIVLNDRLNSSYRVRDNKVTEVTRVAGGSRFTISVIDTMKTDEGKFLSTHFVVSYRDEKTGTLQKVQAFRDAYSQIGGVWLPLSRLVMSFEPEKVTPTSRSLKLANLRTLPRTVTTAALP